MGRIHDCHGHVVTATRGGGRGKKRVLKAILSNCDVSRKDHKLPQLSTTLGIKRMQACLWDMLIIYAVRIVIYPHCLSIVASRQTKLWNESAPDPRQLLCYASSTRNCDWTTQPENATQQLRMPNYYIPSKPGYKRATLNPKLCLQ